MKGGEGLLGVLLNTEQVEASDVWPFRYAAGGAGGVTLQFKLILETFTSWVEKTIWMQKLRMVLKCSPGIKNINRK